ncbi:MAG: hypothetical protein HFI38_04600 [Lachnospiraceae bacterium]|jgi:hypothetical protein|nr:hypothetical protein [Lachnospiraceae bacterium]
MTTLNKGKRMLACICFAVLIGTLAACTEAGETQSQTSGSTESETTAVSDSDAAMTEGESGGEEKEGMDGVEAENGTVPYADNDTVILGTLEAYDPANSAEINAGQAIEGNEEEELQQERIAGGAVGDVVSENLEPLHGIVDPSEGDYTPVYGVNGQ